MSFLSVGIRSTICRASDCCGLKLPLKNIPITYRYIVSLSLLLLPLNVFAQPYASDFRCNDYTEQRQAFFGDLHIHTGISADAMLFGTTNRPDDAYAFARGKSIYINKVFTAKSEPTEAKIERPLDFAAVTDHAENIGTVSLCTDPNSDVYDIEDCQFVRQRLPVDSMASFSSELTKVFHTMYYSENICGKDRSACKAAVKAPWQEIQTAAHEWNNACEFSTFVGYEYSQTILGSNLHHNVIFGTDQVMDVPISSRDVPDIFEFYRLLNDDCNKSKDINCSAIAIPHNSNISNGKMFTLAYADGGDIEKRKVLAQLRADIIPVVESFQEKGDSECRNGLWNVIGQSDEFCDFEKYRDWPDATTGEIPVHDDCELAVGDGGFQNKGCVSRLDYMRGALAAGLKEKQDIGVNSLKFGFIGSTDNHYGTTADLEEWLHNGKDRPVTLIEQGRMSTGGLAGVWSEQNTRESLFAAMQRREVFATSGPRMKVRLFASEKFAKNLCDSPNRIEQAYAQGVAMGSDLVMSAKAVSKNRAPVFLATATQDPGTTLHPGAPLQRLQIIKVWPGEGDQLHQQVYDVAGGANNAEVDESTCQPSGSGHAALCAVWQDPDYQADIDAAYYVRALENPTCRYTGYTCAVADKDDRPAFCDDDTMPKVTQERAWSSPIWVSASPQ